LENVNPDLSDSEYIEREDSLEAATPAAMTDDIGTPGPADGEDEEDEEEDEDAEPEGDIDEELAAELDLALGDEEQGDEDDEENDDDSSDDDEEIDEDDDEDVQAIKLLNEEIRDLEAAVMKKGKEIASSANPLIRVCPLHLWLHLS
jgi:transcription initiation factor TFIID subunit 7